MEEKLGSYINEQEGKLAKMIADTDPSNTLFHSGMIFQLRRTIEDLKSLNEAIVRKNYPSCGHAEKREIAERYECVNCGKLFIDKD